MKIFILLALVGLSFGQWHTHFYDGHDGIVHLFEWHWDTIAEECETFLGPNKFGGVQISPPSENRAVSGRPWWERYQPVSYIIGTRSGDETAFKDMVDRCNAAGVRVYADVVINHMTGADAGESRGTAGSYYDVTKTHEGRFPFPAVYYDWEHFNDENCNTASGLIEDYSDPSQVRDCKLYNLIDLNQRLDYVRETIITYINKLVSLGVAGFRIDAAKHMWPEDLEYIYDSLDYLSCEHGFYCDDNIKPFIYQEVFDQDPPLLYDYFNLGRVTEFKYGLELSKMKNSIQNLQTFNESIGMMQRDVAVVFLNNHDNQRGHGNGEDVITFEDPQNLVVFTTFMMAWGYGIPRIMSSYYFSDSDQGPPEYQPIVGGDLSCGNGWVCEHRWGPIANMPAFAAAAYGQRVSNWWTNGDNQIHFSRGNKAFLAINKSDNIMSGWFHTELPFGNYCNVYAGDYNAGSCTAQCIPVDFNGMANLSIYPTSGAEVVALHVNAMCN